MCDGWFKMASLLVPSVLSCVGQVKWMQFAAFTFRQKQLVICNTIAPPPPPHTHTHTCTHYILFCVIVSTPFPPQNTQVYSSGLKMTYPRTDPVRYSATLVLRAPLFYPLELGRDNEETEAKNQIQDGGTNGGWQAERILPKSPEVIEVLWWNYKWRKNSVFSAN